MNIELIKVNSNKKELLENLLQLYLHDISYYFPIEFDNNTCKYKYNLSSYFNNNYAYFITNNNEIAGFILIDDNSNNNYEISEIFILNNYKNKDIGKETIYKIFNKYKGNWTIKAVPNSNIAESFWDKVIYNYTNNNYKKLLTGKYNRPEYYFNNK